MPSLKRSLVAVCGVLLLASLPLAAGQATAATKPAPKGVYVVMFGDETFADAVIRTGTESPSYRDQVAGLLPLWQQSARTAKGLGSEGIASRSSEGGDLQRINEWIIDPESVKAPAASSPPAATTTTPGASGKDTTAPTALVPKPKAVSGPEASPPRAVAAATSWVNPGNPNSFAVRGAPGSGRTYWTQLNTAIAVDFCVRTCTLYDKITARATVNPGAVTNKISVTTLYSPNHGNLNSFVDLQFKSINRGTVTGTGNAAQQPGSKVWFHGNGKKLNGTVLTISVALGTEIYPPPYNVSQRWDGGKTADATCAAAPNNVCKY